MSKAVLSGESLLEVCGWTKGWVCSRGEGGVGLDLYTWPHTKGSVNGGKSLRMAKRVRSLVGKVTHLCRVYQIVAVTPCSGKGTANAAGKELHEVLVNL